MSHAEQVDEGWRAMALECSRQDRFGRHWYRCKHRKAPDHDDMASEYERLLNEAHAVRVMLLKRDGA